MARKLMGLLFTFACIVSCSGMALAGEISKDRYETVVIKQKGRSYSVDAEYPRFHVDVLPQDVVSKVNKRLELFIKKSISDSLKDGLTGNEFLKHENDGSRSARSESITFKVVRADDHYVSVVFERYHYEKGGVHGLNVIFSFNYDIARRKIVHLKDIFEKGSGYLDELSKLCIKDLLRQECCGLESWVKAGAGPEEVNFAVFALTNKELIIYFQPYQVTSYSGGNPEVHIPLNKLSTLKKLSGAVVKGIPVKTVKK